MDVLIAGGGVGGLAAARALAHAGATVDLVEKRPAEQRDAGVGINLPFNAVAALGQVGISEHEVSRVGTRYRRQTFHDWQGRPVVAVDTAPGREHCSLLRTDLHRMLDGAARSAGARIAAPRTVDSWQESAEGVDVVFDDGLSGRYDVLIGFDGLWSPTRRDLTAVEPTWTGCSVWRVRVPRPAEVEHTMLFQGPHTKAGVIPLTETEMYLLHVTVEPERVQYASTEKVELLRQRLVGFGGLIGDLRDALGPDDDVVYSPLYEVLLEQWHTQRVIVLGDAAHSCTPHLTQGAGMAVEDAVVAADELMTANTVDEGLAAIHTRRFHRVAQVQHASRAVLDEEMAVTDETLPDALDALGKELPQRAAAFEEMLAEAI